MAAFNPNCSGKINEKKECRVIQLFCTIEKTYVRGADCAHYQSTVKESILFLT